MSRGFGIGNRILDTGYRILDTGYRIPDFRCRNLRNCNFFEQFYHFLYPRGIDFEVLLHLHTSWDGPFPSIVR